MQLIALTPYAGCNSIVLVSYHFAEKGKLIPPSTSSRVYPSVKDKLRSELSKGSSHKKATFTVEAEAGGIQSAPNKSSLPTRNQSYYIRKTEKLKKRSDDPLKELISKQKMEENVGESVVKRILMGDGSYVIVVHSNRMIDNIANFCCCDNPNFRSVFGTDFTFNLGEFFVLISVYKNTSLFVKNTTRCPTMLGPAMICHTKNAKVMKIFYDSMLESCPGLAFHLKVVGSDGEKSIMHESCSAFPSSLLLLCMRHAEQNVERKLTELRCSNQVKKRVMEDLFGSLLKKGLLHCEDLDSFDESAERIMLGWDEMEEEPLSEFTKYFKTYKLEQFKYHLSRASVKAAGVVDCPEFFYNNSCEFMNRLVKDWQNKKKLDVYQFVEEYETLAKAQESDVLRAFLGVQSPFVPRPQFDCLTIDFNTEYACLSVNDKKKVTQNLLNVVVEERSYRAVRDYSVGAAAIERARKNLFSKFDQTPAATVSKSWLNEDSHATSNMSAAFDSPQKGRSDKETPDTAALRFLFTNARSNVPETIVMGSIEKAKALVEQGGVTKNFGETSSFLVKSFSSVHPHTVKCEGSGKIFCDSQCVRYQQAGFCGHCIAVAISNDIVESYAAYLERTDHNTFSKLASMNVDKTKAGKKKPLRPRKRKAPSSPDKQTSIDYSASQPRVPAVMVGQSTSTQIQKELISLSAPTFHQNISTTGKILG